MSTKPKVTVYIATSLDGFIARPDGDLDWLDAASAMVPEGEDCGYHALMESVDFLVMGRRTYEKVLSFGEWPYAKTKVVVLSSTEVDLPDPAKGDVPQMAGDPQQVCAQLAELGANHLYVDGGVTIQRFLAAGLVDEITITLIPVLLGRGIPLFGEMPSDVKIHCLEAKHYDFGFVQLKYRVERAS